jgi:hypothetical protein
MRPQYQPKDARQWSTHSAIVILSNPRSGPMALAWARKILPKEKSVPKQQKFDFREERGKAASDLPSNLRPNKEETLCRRLITNPL